MNHKMFELDIIYRDSSIVVVNKPGGLLSVPGRGPDKQDCLVNRIRDLFPECIPQPSVHRLDMDTSGIMVLALTTDAHRNLSIQFQDRNVKKQYIALLELTPCPRVFSFLLSKICVSPYHFGKISS